MEKKGLNFLGRFFLKCSGASFEIINKCPEFERIKYASIGATIFFTALLAFISSFYGLSQIFESYLLIFPLAVFWSIIIFNLDRYIVQSLRSGDSKYESFMISFPRLILAILVAIIISKPLEVKLFEDEITAYLIQQKIEKTAELELRYKEEMKVLNVQKSSYQKIFEDKLRLREKYYKDYMCECNGTCGTGVKGRGIECEERKIKYESYSLELKIEREKTNLEMQRLSLREKEILKRSDSERQTLQASFNQGFFDKIRALQEVGNFASYFIMMIFIMVETAPLLTKLSSKKGPYDNLIMQAEFEFETDFLKIKDFNINQRQKNQKLNKISTALEMKSEETEIKQIIREKALARYEEIRNEKNTGKKELKDV